MSKRDKSLLKLAGTSILLGSGLYFLTSTSLKNGDLLSATILAATSFTVLIVAAIAYVSLLKQNDRS